MTKPNPLFDMKTKTTKTKSKATLSQTAKRLGVSRQLLSAHRKKSDAPPLGDVAAWEEFLALHGREGSAQPELRKKIAEQRLKLLTSMAGREAIRLAKDHREMILRDEVVMVIRKGMSQL